MRVRPEVYRVAWSLSSTASGRLRRRPLVIVLRVNGGQHPRITDIPLEEGRVRVNPILPPPAEHFGLHYSAWADQSV